MTKTNKPQPNTGDTYHAQVTRLTKRTNRLQMQQNRLRHQQKKQINMHRKKRTRTLIQMGGLVEKSGLLEAFEIQTGDDLQDPINLHKAAQILGFLKTIHDENEFGDTEKFQTLGARLLLKNSVYLDDPS